MGPEPVIWRFLTLRGAPGNVSLRFVVVRDGALGVHCHHLVSEERWAIPGPGSWWAMILSILSDKLPWAGILLGFHIAPAQSQDTINKAANCRAAGLILIGRSAEHPLPWAWSRLLYCNRPERDRIHELALRRVRTSIDPQLIAPAVGRVRSEWRIDLLDEVLNIAGDRSATIPARVYAFMTLAGMRDPYAAPRYDDFIGGVDEHGFPRGSCSGRRATPSVASQQGKALTADQAQRIMRLAVRVSRDPGEPDDVRSAAGCI